MLTADAVARMPGLHTNDVDETENLAAGAKDWTTFRAVPSDAKGNGSPT